MQGEKKKSNICLCSLLGHGKRYTKRMLGIENDIHFSCILILPGDDGREVHIDI